MTYDWGEHNAVEYCTRNFPFVPILKQSEKLGYIHTVSKPITDFGEAIVVQII